MGKGIFFQVGDISVSKYISVINNIGKLGNLKMCQDFDLISMRGLIQVEELK